MSEQNEKPPLPETQVKILKFLNMRVVPVPIEELCMETGLPKETVSLDTTLLRDCGWLDIVRNRESKIGYVITSEGRQKANGL
jgi:DNA-binding transcriptional ArsR family regulator